MPSRPSGVPSRSTLAKHLRLIAHDRFITVVDAVFVFVLRAGAHPCGKIAGVLVEQVVDALLQSAADHGIVLGVEARG